MCDCVRVMGREKEREVAIKKEIVRERKGTDRKSERNRWEEREIG